MKCFKCPECKQKMYSSHLDFKECINCFTTIHPEDEIPVKEIKKEEE